MYSELPAVAETASARPWVATCHQLVYSELPAGWIAPALLSSDLVGKGEITYWCPMQQCRIYVTWHLMHTIHLTASRVMIHSIN